MVLLYVWIQEYEWLLKDDLPGWNSPSFTTVGFTTMLKQQLRFRQASDEHNGKRLVTTRMHLGKAVYIKMQGGSSDIVSVVPNLYKRH